MKYTYDLQKIMAESNYLLAIRDNFESILSKSVFAIVESQMDNEEVDINVKNKIFGIVVECVQNICNNDVVDPAKKNSILLLNKLKEGHKIVVGTKLSESRKQRLEKLLSEIGNSNTEQLKEKRKEILSTRSSLEEEQQESLALIDMFTRSMGQVKYYFDETTDESFLIIEIIIANS